MLFQTIFILSKNLENFVNGLVVSLYMFVLSSSTEHAPNTALSITLNYKYLKFTDSKWHARCKTHPLYNK